MFLGRENELNEIKDGLKTDRFEAFLIYGRRRVGKTELINAALEGTNKLVVSYECIKTTIEENKKLFTEKLKNIFKEDYIAFTDFADLLAYIFEKSLSKDIVLFIDEFSFLLQEDFSIESRLASLIDSYKSKTKLKLFLSGSYVSLMQKMVEYNAHSYGRFTHIMSIRPFDYYDAALFYPNYTNEEKIMLYSTFGGVPYFCSLIDTNKSALQNILDLIIKKDSILEHEINEIILAETGKINNINYLISTLARGVCKYKDIVNNLSSSNISKPDYLLNKLIDMNIIRKEFPINDENNKKRTKYAFSDNLLHFYYRYIFHTPYQDFRSNPTFFYENFVKESFINDYIPKKFEAISMDFLKRCNMSNMIHPIFDKIGNYSYDDAKNKINREFDIVTHDKNGYISYECKYSNAPIDNLVIEEELKQTSNLELNFYKLGFISKNGFTKNVDKEKYNCFSLNDFYIKEIKQ